MELSSQLHAPAALPSGKEPPIPIGQETVWDQSSSGRGGEENKNPYTTSAGNRNPIFKIHSLVTILTDESIHKFSRGIKHSEENTVYWHAGMQ
jgi:hypothetical protein